MADTNFNYAKYKLLNNWAGKTFTLLLMQPGFVPNQATDLDYADISASEVATAYGYTSTTGLALTVSGVTQDDSANKGVITFADVSITPSGGNIALCGGIIHNVTDDVLVRFIDAGGTVVATNGQPYAVTNITVTLA